MIEDLKLSGNDPSKRERLTKVVIGVSSAGRHDLRSLVGIESRKQVASDDVWMAEAISSGVAGEKFSNGGGGETGMECGEKVEAAEGVNDEDILAILSAKKVENELAMVLDDVNVGSTVGVLRERSVSMAVQSLCG